MRVLIVGASGLIGAAIAAKLASSGHQVVGVGRANPHAFHPLEWIGLDLAQAVKPAAWLPLLQHVDAVVNCAGTLQDSPHDSTHAVHVAATSALFDACEQSGVRRVIHFSAVGVERAATQFSKTKLKGHEGLMSRDLDWVILRPSVVIGRNGVWWKCLNSRPRRTLGPAENAGCRRAATRSP